VGVLNIVGLPAKELRQIKYLLDLGKIHYRPNQSARAVKSPTSPHIGQTDGDPESALPLCVQVRAKQAQISPRHPMGSESIIHAAPQHPRKSAVLVCGGRRSPFLDRLVYMSYAKLYFHKRKDLMPLINFLRVEEVARAHQKILKVRFRYDRSHIRKLERADSRRVPGIVIVSGNFKSGCEPLARAQIEAVCPKIARDVSISAARF
jgi:hypothetical protein